MVTPQSQNVHKKNGLVSSKLLQKRISQ